MAITQRLHQIPPACQERYLDLLPAAAEPLRRAGVVFCGVSRLRAGYHVAHPEPADTHMIILTDGGMGRLTDGEQTWDLRPGDLMVGPAGRAYEFFVVEDGWDISWFYLADRPGRGGLRGPVRHQADVNTGPVTEAMEGYLREAARPACQALAAQYAGLTVALLERLLSGVATAAPGDEGSRLERLWQRVRLAPHLPWRMPALARAAGLSVSTLQRQVRRSSGCSPYQVVIRLRMEQACLLLRSSDYPLKLIAARVGYADEFIFSAAFRRYIGQPPSRWRQEVAGDVPPVR